MRVAFLFGFQLLLPYFTGILLSNPKTLGFSLMVHGRRWVVMADFLITQHSFILKYLGFWKKKLVLKEGLCIELNTKTSTKLIRVQFSLQQTLALVRLRSLHYHPAAGYQQAVGWCLFNRYLLISFCFWGRPSWTPHTQLNLNFGFSTRFTTKSVPANAEKCLNYITTFWLRILWTAPFKSCITVYL